MSWIQTNPFDHDEDTSQLMLTLLANEAEKARDPFNENEKQILASSVLHVPIELDAKARRFINQLFEREQAAGIERDPKGFGSCLQWSDCAESSNLLELTHHVAAERSAMQPASEKWKGRIKDKIALVGCAFVAVVLLMLFAAAIEFLSGHK
jgi:hypothetical protein